MPESATPSLTLPEAAPAPPCALLTPDSPIRLTALKIIAMRQAGVDEGEIAAALGLARTTLAGYVYKAGKMGWLDSDNPHDALEYQILHKVVRNLSEGLDLPPGRELQNGMPVRTQVALKIGEGTLFKKFAADQQAAAPSTVVAIRIETGVPSGPVPTIREGTTGGAPAFIEGDLSDVAG